MSDRKLTKCETIFAGELALIRGPGIVQSEIWKFVVDCFEKVCPDTFWTQSASSSGKYHPQVSNGEGGLVRHTKLAVWWGLELARAFELEDMTDLIVATLLLHDVLKRHDNVGTHGLELAYRLPYVAFVTEGIAYHMGRWTTGEINDATYVVFCRLVHLADYCAGRKTDEKLAELGTGLR